MPAFVVAENWTLEDFFSLVTFSELLHFNVICEVWVFWTVGVHGGIPELGTVAHGSGWFSNFEMNIEVWLQRAGSRPGPTADV
jgi:hypothetical protein